MRGGAREGAGRPATGKKPNRSIRLDDEEYKLVMEFIDKMREGKNMKLVNGYEIKRGAYSGTTDDRIDRWYIEDPNSNVVDRRGAGYRTKKEAAEAAKELPAAK